MSELAYHTHNQSYALRAAKDIVQLQKRLMDGMCDFTFWNSKLYVNKKKFLRNLKICQMSPVPKIWMHIFFQLVHYIYNQSYALKAAKDIVQFQKQLLDG